MSRGGVGGDGGGATRVALRRQRLAVVGLFFLTGLGLAMWVVDIPAVRAHLGLSHSVLGGLLLLLGAGAVVGMQASGFLVDRIGGAKGAAAGSAVLAAGVVLPGLAGGGGQLGAALFVLGVGNGLVNVAMNDQAVHLERRWGSPIMSGFHAFFSIGGAAGAVVGASLQSAGASVRATLATGAALVAALALVSLLALVGPGATPGPTGDPAAAPEGGAPAGNRAAAPAVTARHVAGRIVALASLAFLLMLAEGTANDWSALQAVEHLHQPAAAASLAYGAFAVAMTAGRFAADPVAHRVGPVHVVRLGSAVAAAGMLVVVLSAHYPLTLLGWVVFGLGLSGIVPQIFTAAGNLGVADQGAVLSRVVSTGYVGLLAGPAVIGGLSGRTGLTHALALPLVLCLVGVLLAPQVAPSTRRAAARARGTAAAAVDPTRSGT